MSKTFWIALAIVAGIPTVIEIWEAWPDAELIHDLQSKPQWAKLVVWKFVLRSTVSCEELETYFPARKSDD